MLFIALCVDKPKSAETRVASRPAHLDFLGSLGAQVKIAGPLLADDHQTPVGSMLIFEGDSEADIRAILARDPYTLAGLFESVTVRPWRQAVGQTLA